MAAPLYHVREGRDDCGGRGERRVLSDKIESGR